MIVITTEVFEKLQSENRLLRHASNRPAYIPIEDPQALYELRQRLYEKYKQINSSNFENEHRE